MELNLSQGKFIPRKIYSNLGGFIFILSSDGIFKIKESLLSGNFVFGADRIEYAGQVKGSTTAHAFVLMNYINNLEFYELFAYEMIQTFQFQEFSGINYFPKPLIDKWRAKSKFYNGFCNWVYSDLNYEAMLINYFIIQGGHEKNYSSNFLENEAEFLSVGRPAGK